MIRINGLACFLLVLLRLAVGWHFAVEGGHKLYTHYTGKTSWNEPWTGEGFFKEGIGPAAPYARELLHLDDRDALARLKADDHKLPIPVNADWEAYFARFQTHYSLTDAQKSEASARFANAKQDTANWLAGDVPSEVKKQFAWGVETVRQSVPMRLAEYDAKVKEVDDILSRRLPAFNKDVEKARLRTLKADASKLLASLLGDLDERTAEMKKSLAEVLTPDQQQAGPVPGAEVSKPVRWLDLATMWGHTILGSCLLLGLVSRLASFLLALFLVSVNLIAPALPYGPTPPGAIGYYLYVNLYVIELLVLLVLASVPTGRWFGVDAFVHYVFHGPPRPAAVNVAGRRVAAAR